MLILSWNVKGLGARVEAIKRLSPKMYLEEIMEQKYYQRIWSELYSRLCIVVYSYIVYVAGIKYPVANFRNLSINKMPPRRVARVVSIRKFRNGYLGHDNKKVRAPKQEPDFRVYSVWGFHPSYPLPHMVVRPIFSFTHQAPLFNVAILRSPTTQN